MSWFKRKKQAPTRQVVDVHASKHAQYREQQERVFAKYPIGREFDYIGVRLRVVEHTFFRYGPAFDQPASFKCAYVDGQGVLRSVRLCCRDVDRWEV